MAEPTPPPNADAANPYAAMLRHIPPEDIPASNDFLSAEQLRTLLEPERRYDLLLLGDLMLGEKLARRIDESGLDYPFAAMLPLLRKSALVVANLEAPFATAPRDPTERYSYRVPPRLVEVLTRAGLSAVNLANNHLVDCGREGVRQTLATLARAGIGAFGAGQNEAHARLPLILHSGPHRIGLLGWYWNTRCAATATQPGCALSDPTLMEAAIRDLRPKVDYLVANFHWGDTYSRQPSEKAQMKARLAIDAGADLVIGHHPHVLQPLEIHHGRPIFYSLGNCLMGSGNSRAEGLAVALRLSPQKCELDAYPLYVKNRDPRIQYQTKVLVGAGAAHVLANLQSKALIPTPGRPCAGIAL